jgi:SWI/SNF chromatin-remodeling complex subunit SWI1
MYHNANIEKQMLALSATSLAKMANPSAPNRSSLQSPSLGHQQSGPNYFGGNSHPSETQVTSHDFTNGFAHSASPMSSIAPSSFPDPGLRPNPQQMQMLQKRRQFLHGIATVMAQRNTPLPPQLTGVNHPSYDPSTSVWKMLEISPTEPGLLRIAGKDVDLYRLWGLVFQNGGAMKVRALPSARHLF